MKVTINVENYIDAHFGNSLVILFTVIYREV